MTSLINFFDKNGDGIVDNTNWGPLAVLFGAGGIPGPTGSTDPTGPTGPGLGTRSYFSSGGIAGGITYRWYDLSNLLQFASPDNDIMMYFVAIRGINTSGASYMMITAPITERTYRTVAFVWDTMTTAQTTYTASLDYSNPSYVVLSVNYANAVSNDSCWFAFVLVP